VQENKMVKAKYLLQQNKLSLQEISAIVGYASLSSFSQTYKNYYGISPSIEKKQISNS
jgi:AraC-like DNA-binding protein